MSSVLSNEIEQALAALRQAIVKQIDELTAASLLKEQSQAPASSDNHLETVVLPNAPAPNSPSGMVAGGAEVDNSLPYPNLPEQAVNLPTPPSPTPTTLPVNQPQEVAIPHVNLPNLTPTSPATPTSFNTPVGSAPESTLTAAPAAPVSNPTSPLMPSGELTPEFVPSPSEQVVSEPSSSATIDFASNPSQASFAKARGLLSSVLQKNS